MSVPRGTSGAWMPGAFFLVGAGSGIAAIAAGSWIGFAFGCTASVLAALTSLAMPQGVDRSFHNPQDRDHAEGQAVAAPRANVRKPAGGEGAAIERATGETIDVQA